MNNNAEFMIPISEIEEARNQVNCKMLQLTAF